MASEHLSDVEVRNAKPTAKPRKLGDGNGLTLIVHPNGSKYWQQRYTLHGKEKTLQLPELNITQQELADRLGVSRRTVSEILNEHRPLTPDMAIRIGKLLNTTPESWLRMQQTLDQ
jgi:addiction module HigA family antidote